MTTEQAAALYEAQHLQEMKDKGYAVYNPGSKSLSELPVIYGFNNGGDKYFLHGCLLAEDGTELGSHSCSSESYMWHDLGILKGTRADRHEEFKRHYPGGYRMDFVSYNDVESNPGLMRAIALSEEPTLIKDEL